MVLLLVLVTENGPTNESASGGRGPEEVGMNVLLVTMVDVSGKSGENIYSKEVIAAFARNSSVNLSLICPKPLYATLSELGVYPKKVYYLPQRISRQVWWHLRVQFHMLKALRRVINAEKPDLIVATLKVSLILPPLFAKWHRIPYILLVEGILDRNVKERGAFPGAHFLAKLVAKLNVCSACKVYAAHKPAKEWIETLQKLSQRKIQLFHSAVNPGLFQPTAAASARKRLGLPLSDGDFVVGFIGSFKARHSLPALIEATSNLVNEIPELKLLLVGEGPEHQRIVNLVHRKGLERRIVFTGFVSHDSIPMFISACDITYSVTSLGHWANPMKCYESLACERPVIIRETEDLAFVAENHFGVMVKSDNPEEISEAIKKLYNLGVEHRLSVGKAARRYILKHHAWDRLVKLILECAHS